MNSASPLNDRTSPYLRMHADDPVQWLHWSPLAFERATAEDRLVLLSVGYASCHWCHVMQRESFRDPVTAAYINDHYIALKVDREERPDVDALYMEYVAAATGGGGWPMTVILTPDGLPVFGGTYFPLEAHGGSPSFMDVLRSVSTAWIERRDELERTAEAARDFLERRAEPPVLGEIDERLIESAAQALLRTEDTANGGFGSAPKFPQAPILNFLLRYATESGDDEAARAARDACRAMLRGGIHDHVGGGLFRYATDATWLVPHFEKMLYDNALLLSVLARAVEYEPDDEFEHAIRTTAEFLEREMSAPAGGYIASLSAETEGIEGATYVWTHDELTEFLSVDEIRVAEQNLGIAPQGNWEGSTIITRHGGRENDPDAVDVLLDHLAKRRALRPQPAGDSKVVVSWNALAARGLLDAGAALSDPILVERGRSLVSLLVDRAVDDGVLHVLDDPDVAAVRLLEDAAHLVAALITVHEITGDDDALDTAIELQHDALVRFVEDGTAFMTDDLTDLPVRPREQNDNPVPSGASTLAENALRLYRYTLDERDRALAEEILSRSVSLAEFAPVFAGTALDASIILVTEE